MQENSNISSVIESILENVRQYYREEGYTEYLGDIEEYLEKEYRRAKLSEEFRIQLQRYNFEYTYCKLFGPADQSIALYGKDHRRTISWSDDGRQPENEWLYCVSFPSGAYFFGNSYPEEHFNAMFEELKGFGPKYSDTTNHNLYFDSSNAKGVHQQLPEIVKKYRDTLKEFEQTKEIENLEKRLQELKASK